MDVTKLAESIATKRAAIVKIAAGHLRAADRAEQLTCLSCVGLVVLGEGFATHWLPHVPALASAFSTFLALTYSIHAATRSKRKYRVVFAYQKKLDSLSRKLAVHQTWIARSGLGGTFTASVPQEDALLKLASTPAEISKPSVKQINLIDLFGSCSVKNERIEVRPGAGGASNLFGQPS